MLTQLQKAIVGVGAGCLVLLACYLPWTYTLNAPNGINREKPAGYHPIFDPPPPEEKNVAYGVRVDVPRVAIPMAIVVLATAAGVLLTGAKRGEHSGRERPDRTSGPANEGSRLAEERNRPLRGESDPSARVPSALPAAPEPVATPSSSPDHSRQERGGTPLFSTAIAVVVIWGACRAVFGSGFGGLCEGFVVILVGSVVGPWVARRLSSNSSAVPAADAAHDSSPNEDRSTPAPPTGEATTPVTHSLLTGPPLSLVLVALVGSAIGVAVVLFTRNTNSPPGNVSLVTPPPHDKRDAVNTSDNPILAPLSNKRGDDTPTEKLDYDAIIRREDEFIRRDPSDTHAYHIRGFAWLEKKEYEKAISDFTQAIRSQPKHPEEGARASSFVHRGTALLEKGDIDAAIEDFDEVLRLSPKYAHAHSGRANAWSDKGEYEKAIKDYEEAIRIGPKSRFEDYINLAWLLATCPADKVRDGPRAIQLATCACELSDWKSGWALSSLAAAYAEAGRFDEALRYHKRAHEDPTYPWFVGTELEREVRYEYKKPLRGPVQHHHPTGHQAPFRR